MVAIVWLISQQNDEKKPTSIIEGSYKADRNRRGGIRRNSRRSLRVPF